MSSFDNTGPVSACLWGDVAEDVCTARHGKVVGTTVQLVDHASAPNLTEIKFQIPPTEYCISDSESLRPRLLASFRPSVRGVIIDLQPLEMALAGNARRVFDIVDGMGSFLSCCAGTTAACTCGSVVRASHLDPPAADFVVIKVLHDGVQHRWVLERARAETWSLPRGLINHRRSLSHLPRSLEVRAETVSLAFKHTSAHKDPAWSILVAGGRPSSSIIAIVAVLPTALLAAVLLGPRSGAFAAALVLRLRTFKGTAKAPLRLVLV